MQKLPIALGTICTNDNLLVLAQDYSRVVQKIEDAVAQLNSQKAMIQRHVKELYPTRRMNQVFAYGPSLVLVGNPFKKPKSHA